MTTLDIIDFPSSPVDGQIHKEGSETYVYIAAESFWLGGQAGQMYLLNKSNIGFLQKFYLGAYDRTHAPSKMPNGDPLTDFVLYFDTTSDTMMMWHGGTVNQWKSMIRPVPADSKIYTYVANGSSKKITGKDVNGQTLTLDPANKEKVVVWNGTYLTESTPKYAADYEVDYVNSTINLTRVPRKNTTFNIHVLSADASKIKTKDPVIFHISKTSKAKSFAGTLPSDKIEAAIAPISPQVGMLAVVSHDPAVGADNSYEGLWYYDGAFKNIFKGSASGGGSRVFTTTATILDNRKGTLVKPTEILDSNFASIFSTPAQDGDWVVVPLVQGNLSKYSGLYVRNPSDHKFTPAATSYSTHYIEGYVRTALTRLNDIDITTKGIPTGSIQAITDGVNKEILVASETGTWISMYSEAQVHKWAAEASLWRSAIPKSLLATLPTPAAGNKGQYWTWLGEPDPLDPTRNVGGQTVDNTFPKISPSLDGEKLQIGDWIQSDGTKWIHVPADLLNKSRWIALGSFIEYKPSTSHEKYTLARFKPKGAAGSWHYYQANADVTITDKDPSKSAKWDDITPKVSPDQLDNVVAKATLENEDILIYNDTTKQWELKPLPATGVNDWSGSVFYHKTGTFVLRANLGAGDTNWKTDTVPMLYRSLSNTTPNMNKDPLDPLEGLNFWEPIVQLNLGQLANVDASDAADKKGVFWDEGTKLYKFKYINDLLQWEDRDYDTTEVVFNKGKFYRPNKAIVTGDAEPSETNADWDLIKGISNLNELDDIDDSSVQNNSVLVYDETMGQWIASEGDEAIKWEDKDYFQGALVYEDSTNMFWVSSEDVGTGDDGPDITKIGTTGFKWYPVGTIYKPSVWDGVKQEVEGTFVIRKPLGGTDTYTGVPVLFICNKTASTDPVVNTTDFTAIGSAINSIGDLDDVDITTTVPKDKDILIWSDTDKMFKPDKVPTSVVIEKYDVAKAYKKDTYVDFQDSIYRAGMDIIKGIGPSDSFAKTLIVTKTQIGEATLTNNSAAGKVNFDIAGKPSALTFNVGDYYKFDGGTPIGGYPFTIATGEASGLEISEQTGWIMIVDKSDPAVKGHKGYIFIPDSKGIAPATPTNRPAGAVEVSDYGLTDNPWVQIGAAAKSVPHFPITYIGNVALVVADIADPTKNYGMPATTSPSPTEYPPRVSDTYINTADLSITRFN